ncbi:amidase [Myxococcota bacterium]|nr:amidase [Myxococcota bacterium]
MVHEAPFGLSVEAAIAQIEARERDVRAFVRTRLDEARTEDAARSREPRRSELHRVPYALKDLWDTAKIPTTGCSHRFKDRVPDASAPIHDVLEEAGAILLGKTNSSDLGLAMESQSYVGGTTRNPHDPTRTAGGSSGGAAAAVAAGMVAFDWGSDFGGSIRLPSAYCGIYGLRLSSEAWPMVGHFPMPPAALKYLNGQGPMTASLSLMRTLLRIARPRIRTGNVRKFELQGALIYAPEGAYAGDWPTFAEDVEPVLRKAVGVARRDHGLPTIGRAFDIARSMYSSHLEAFLESDTSLTFMSGLKSVLGAIAFQGKVGKRTFHPRTAEMLLLIALGRATLYRDAERALRDAKQYRDDVGEAWDKGWVIALPTVPYSAPRHGRSIVRWRIPSAVMPGNIADATGLAVPFGRFADGLPRSIQLWGPPGSEDTLLDVAEKIDAARATS